MIFKTNEEFSTYVARRAELSGLTQKQIAEKLDRSPSLISHALNKGGLNDTSRNGIRFEILALFGYKVRRLLEVTWVVK